jgi:hypothetical protein
MTQIIITSNELNEREHQRLLNPLQAYIAYIGKWRLLLVYLCRGLIVSSDPREYSHRIQLVELLTSK